MSGQHSEAEGVAHGTVSYPHEMDKPTEDAPEDVEPDDNEEVTP